MLATIIKSTQATEASLTIIETFAKLRDFTSTINALPDVQDDKSQESSIPEGMPEFSPGQVRPKGGRRPGLGI